TGTGPHSMTWWLSSSHASDDWGAHLTLANLTVVILLGMRSRCKVNRDVIHGLSRGFEMPRQEQISERGLNATRIADRVRKGLFEMGNTRLGDRNELRR